jgi:hypothetical protein
MANRLSLAQEHIGFPQLINDPFLATAPPWRVLLPPSVLDTYPAKSWLKDWTSSREGRQGGLTIFTGPPPYACLQSHVVLRGDVRVAIDQSGVRLCQALVVAKPDPLASDQGVQFEVMATQRTSAL